MYVLGKDGNDRRVWVRSTVHSHATITEVFERSGPAYTEFQSIYSLTGGELTLLHIQIGKDVDAQQSAYCLFGSPHVQALASRE